MAQPDSVLDLTAVGGGSGRRESRASRKSWLLRVVAILDRRSSTAERNCSLYRDIGGFGKSFKALKVSRVRLLSMLKCEASKVMEDDLDAAGFRGTEKELDIRRGSMGSDLDLTSAGAGNSKPSISSYTSFTKSSQQEGS